MHANFARMPVLVAAALASLPLLGSAASACDTRHFYNKSPVTFDLSMGGDAQCSIGSSGMQQICNIPPGQTAEIHYGSTHPNIAIFSPTKYYIFPMHDFSVDPASCKIDDRGKTGNIAVNVPNNGDVTTCGSNGWTCRQ